LLIFVFLDNSKIIHARHISDDHIMAPLVISDFDNTKDSSLKSIIQNCNNDIGRKKFQSKLLSSNTNHINRRSYIDGALYVNLPDYVYVLDHTITGDIDLSVDHINKNNISTSKPWVMVRKVSQQSNLIMQLKNLALCCKSQSGNARSKSQDKGKMFAIGTRILQGNQTDYAVNKHFHHYPSVCSKLALEFAMENFPSTITNMIEIERNAGVYPSNLMGGYFGIVSTMDMSCNLGNASHYDRNDASQGFSIWVETKCNSASNWYFLMPNMILHHQNKQYNGVAVKLSDGVSISWDGRVIRHCTTVTNSGNNNSVHGIFWAAKKSIYSAKNK
jgi:hypothetical protein